MTFSRRVLADGDLLELCSHFGHLQTHIGGEQLPGPPAVEQGVLYIHHSE